ncbi:MAG: carbohydrate-binding domain-containing protein [Clostridia bacterium]|nr:carbohydrate-binding domain-containing protein [Clostridia bacterium]
MKNKIKLISLFLSALLLCSCGSKNAPADSTESTKASPVTELTEEKISKMFTERDLDCDPSDEKSAEIELMGTTASSSSDAVNISGSTVTITDEGTYLITGELSDGMLCVDAGKDDKVHLVFDKAQIKSSTDAPLYILEADKVVVTLADKSENLLENGGSFEIRDDNNIDGAVFSKADLTLNGTGSLQVISPAGHGIVCKDDLVICGGAYTVDSQSHGIDANDSVRLRECSLTVSSGKDAIHAENSDDASLGFVYIRSAALDAVCEGDGISASSYMQIEDGDFKIVAGGGYENGENKVSENFGGFMGGRGPGKNGFGTDISETENEESTSMKGLKSSGNMTVNGGSFNIDSADDCVHSNASLTVNSGVFSLLSGDDGFHADESLTVVDGEIKISESYEGLEALDISILGADISLCASDDGLNAAGGNDESGFGGGRGDKFGPGGGFGGPGGMGQSSGGSIVISGGKLYIEAMGDGIDANGTLEITGGYTVVCGPSQGDTATLDYDTSAKISGGTFIGTGGAGMAQTFSDASQGVIAVSVGNQQAKAALSVSDSKGNVICNTAPELSFAVCIISSPDIEKGESYTLTIGDMSDTVVAQ